MSAYNKWDALRDEDTHWVVIGIALFVTTLFALYCVTHPAKAQALTLSWHCPTLTANGDTLHTITGTRVVRWQRVAEYDHWPWHWTPAVAETVYSDTLMRVPGSAVTLTLTSVPCMVATWAVLTRDRAGWSDPSNGAP